MTDAPSPGRPRPALLLAAAGLAGAGVMTVELSAVRLIAPRFGTSSAVWTNVIGVVLLALSLGYLLGARLSRGPRPARALGWTLVLGAALVVWLPALAGPVCAAFFPDGTALDEAVSLLVLGSLAASTVLFLPAATLLGCAAPLCTEAVQRARGGGAGESGGRVLAASTVGSLAGAFGTTYLFLPVLGLSASFLSAGAVLATAGLLVLLGSGERARALLVALPIATAFPLSHTEPRPVREGERLLATRQSAYQSLRVVESGSGDERRRRLEVNEGLDSFQSVWQPEPGLLGGGHYYDLFALPAWWSHASGTWRALVLGLGAGTATRVLEGASPPGVTPTSVGVEIDPVVVDLARAHFDLLEGPDHRVHAGLDARAALTFEPGPFDQVILDCYANQVEIPAHLTTVEFFGEVREALAPDGWLTINAAGFGLDDPVVDALAVTAAAAFPEGVAVLRVPFSRNCMIVARRDAPVVLPGDTNWPAPDERFDELLRALEVPGAWRRVPSQEGQSVLTDDHSPMERLQLQSLTEGRRRWLEQQP